MRLKHSLLLLLLLSSCASGLMVDSDASPPSKRTVILFLVDGLGSKLLQAGIRGGKMANTKRFFLKNKTAFAQGQAAFPSLTYPNLSSVLTTKGVGEQPVAANHMVINGKEINYESAFRHDDLERAVDPQSVFNKLAVEGRQSASFSYVLGQNATDHMAVGLQEGLEYQNHAYKALDDRLLTSLEDYLGDKESAEWPAFIYVHLVGVDGTAHLYGSRSKETQEYLSWLDERMEPIYEILKNAEKRKQVTTMLTADHGFVDTSRFVNLEKFIHHVDKTLTVTNESRFLGLYLPKNGDRAKFETLLTQLRALPGVELTVERKDTLLDFSTARQTLAFGYGPGTPECMSAYSLAPASSGSVPAASQYHCPEELNSAIQPYPFLVSGLSRYMNSANHPDAVVIAKPDTSFTKDHKGNHGGPTADEMLVPILLRNAEMHSDGIPHTSDLLKTLDSL